MGNRCSQRRNQKWQCPGVPWKNPAARVLEREAGGRRETRVREPTWPTSHSSGPEDHLTPPGKAEIGHLWAFQGLLPKGLGCSSFPETHYTHSSCLLRHLGWGGGPRRRAGRGNILPGFHSPLVRSLLLWPEPRSHISVFHEFNLK